MIRYLILFIYISYVVAAQDVKQGIERILNTLPASTEYSILIINPDLKDTIYKKNIFRSMIPASNTKLFTTAAAFDLMGPDYKISTKILTDGVRYGNKLEGNLFIKGFGNPLFNESDLDSLIKKLTELNIKEISGNIIGDDTFFDDIYSREDWIFEESANVPLPPVSALTINRNSIQVTLRKAGKKTTASVYPSLELIKIVNTQKGSLKLVSDKHGIALNVPSNLGRRKARVYYVNIDNPPLFTAAMLYEKLLKAGIIVKGLYGTGETPAKCETLCESSITLSYLAGIINKRSENYYAENLFKIIGAQYSKKQGNSFYATQAVITFLERMNVYNEGSSFVDGSGISRYNEVTAASIAGLLESIYYDESLYKSYLNSLSISGVDGTLRNRMTGSPAAGKFYGKTGTLRGVTALSGYLLNSSNQTIIVAITMEFKTRNWDYHKGIEDKIVEYISRNY